MRKLSDPLKPTAFLSLRWSVLIAAIILWNALNALAIWLNGGWHPYHAKSALLTLVLCLTLSAMFLWLLASSARFVRWAVAERRASYYHQPTFAVVAVLVSVMAGCAAYAWLAP